MRLPQVPANRKMSIMITRDQQVYVDAWGDMGPETKKHIHVWIDYGLHSDNPQEIVERCCRCGLVRWL